MPRAKNARRGSRKSTRGARGARGAVGGDVLGSLHAAREELLAQRASLDQQLSALDQALNLMGGGARRGRPGRPAAHSPAQAAPTGAARGGRRGPRANSLKVFITRVLSGSQSPMAVKEITAGVRRAGYETRNKTLAKSVGIALTQMPDVQKVGRGVFKLK